MDSLKMSRSKGEGREFMLLNSREFWFKEFMSLSQKSEKRVRKFTFLVRHHFKVELCGYIYIVVNIYQTYVVLY